MSISPFVLALEVVPMLGHRFVTFLSKKRCRVCSGPLSVHQEVRGGICDAPACRRAGIELARQARATALYEEAAGDSPRGPLVIVPAAVLSTGNLREKRRRRFRDHLFEVVTQAYSPAVQSEPYAPQLAPTAEEASVLAAVCGICQGHCCMTGRNHAWVDVDAVRRTRSMLNGARPIAVLDIYFDSLPNRHCVGSCVFHTTAGCALPEGVRGSVCNGYFCPGLQRLANHMREGATAAFIVAMDGLQVVRSGWVG